ncbi:MAG: hypothetical protein ACLUB5_00660 [Bifidobacterium dentium]
MTGVTCSITNRRWNIFLSAQGDDGIDVEPRASSSMARRIDELSARTPNCAGNVATA